MSAPPAQAPSPRCSRMADPAMFREVLARRPVRKTEHFGLHAAPVERDASPTSAPWCVGVVIPKRLAKRAVTRNAIRRRIYVAADACLRIQAFEATGPNRMNLVVRLARPWGPDELRSATRAAWRAGLWRELQALFATPLPQARA